MAKARDAGPFALDETPIHIDSRPDRPAVPLPGFGFDPPAFMDYMKKHCEQGAPGRLVMIESTPKDWGSWERHTAGDELVIILEGEGDFIQEIDGEQHRLPVRAGDTVLNPRGVWHTADVREPIRAIYITPCPGTEHRER